MKRQKKLMILSAVLVICIGAAFFLSRIDFEEKMKGEETAIIDVDSSEITYLSWNYEEEVSFRYEDDKWQYTQDENMSVDQELLGDIAEDLSEIISDKKVEDVKNLSLYGLSDPAYTLTVEADQTYEISIGDESFTDGEVYISNGDGYVYLTDSGLIDKISYSLLDLVQKEEIPEMETVSSVSVEKDSPVNIVYKEESGYCYSDAYTYYLKDGEEYQNLDNDNTASVIETLTGFSWAGCADYYAEDSELEDYGLDDPDAAVSIKYKDDEGEQQTFEYELGVSGENYYAKLKDSRIVYSIGQEVYEAAKNASYEELKPDEVILLNWDTVESIDIELDGSLYTVELESKDEDEYTYTFNGEEIAFEDALEELSALTLSEDEKAEADNNKSELSLTFHRNTEEYSSVELDFYQYNGSYCIPVLNGETLNCVDRDAVVSFKEAVNSAILDSGSEE